MFLKSFVLAVSLFSFVGCVAHSPSFSMYPQAIAAGQNIEANVAVVLVGNAGPASLDYLQFTHASLPAINVRNILIPPNGIVAVPIAVGVRSLQLSNYTVAGHGAGYLPSGMSVGFIPVHTPKIDISAPGVYYIATVLPGSAKKYSVDPDTAMLVQFKNVNPSVARLKPVNFDWPK